jgi:UDP-N-acetylglucosamine diphosphorylase/glucosamine-1-phosphate N-acetyltransferase
LKVCMFEDEKCANFHPLALTRPVYCLKFGMEEIYRRCCRILGTGLGGTLARDHLAGISELLTGVRGNERMDVADEDWLFLNGRILDPKGIEPEGPDEVGIMGSDIIYVRASRKSLEGIWTPDLGTFLNSFLENHEHREVQVRVADYIWDIVLGNAEALTEDIRSTGRSGIEGEMSRGSYVVGDEGDVYVSPTAKLDPLVVLDASHGPIYLDEEARVFPHTRVEGPCYVGPGSQLVGGKIREGCTIGPVCRIGGELEESIFHGYSNKYHDGFIGHSYVGEWVNLGALTTNSDLKNDYSGVQTFVQGRLVDTGSPKVGSFIGDHVKTAIGTLLNTGTVVGPMSVLMPSGEVLPKNIPAFCLLIRNKIRGGLGLENLISTARAVMARRGIEMTPEEVDMLKRAYEITADDRENLIRRDRRKRARS